MTHAMNARGIFFGFFFMAMRTIRRRQTGIVNQFLDAGMTICATQFGVDGRIEIVRRENRQWNVFAIHHPASCAIAMAIEAVGIGQFIVCPREENANQEAG
jgi:hypothetical protein